MQSVYLVYCSVNIGTYVSGDNTLILTHVASLRTARLDLVWRVEWIRAETVVRPRCASNIELYGYYTICRHF